MKKAIAYIRISSKTQVENTSLSMQTRKIRAFADSQECEIVEVFEDVATGATIEREGYQNMIQYLSINDIDCIISYKIDRIHRNQINFLTLIEQLDKRKIAYLSVRESIDTSTPIGKLMLNVLSMFSEFERSAIADRINCGKSEKEAKIKEKNDDTVVSGRSPYAFDSNFRVDEKKKEIVKLIFSSYMKHKSLAKVAKIVEERGFFFSTKTLSRMLRNKMYLGIYTYRNIKYNKHHEAIVTPYVFGRVKQILER